MLGENKVFRQGDVIISSIIAIPDDACESNDKIIAIGEKTSHAHRIPNNGIVFECPSAKRRFLRVISGGLNITHEEHLDVVLPVGDYEIKQQREFDWWNEEVRRVVD